MAINKPIEKPKEIYITVQVEYDVTWQCPICGDNNTRRAGIANNNDEVQLEDGNLYLKNATCDSCDYVVTSEAGDWPNGDVDYYIEIEEDNFEEAIGDIIEEYDACR